MKFNRHVTVAVSLFLSFDLLIMVGIQRSQAQTIVSSTQAGTSPYAARVFYRSEAERIRILSDTTLTIDDHFPTTQGFVMVWITDAKKSSLEARGLRVERDDARTRAMTVTPTFINEPEPQARYLEAGLRSLEAIRIFLNRKAANYSRLAQLVNIGPSWCKQKRGGCSLNNPTFKSSGYDLWLLKITNRDIGIPGQKPVFWLDAGIHSGEYMVPEIAMYFIEWLLDGYSTNAEARWLVDEHEINVLVMMNPDGRSIIEQTPVKSGYIARKNANSTECSTWPAQISPPPESADIRLGVDLNRNYPEWWGTVDRSCRSNYAGPWDLSEPETWAVYKQLVSLFKSRLPEKGPALLSTVGTFQSLHNAGNINYYPWLSTKVGTPPPNQIDLANIANRMGIKPGTGGNGYKAEQTYLSKASFHGVAVDTVYGQLGIPAFSTETSETEPRCLLCGWYENRDMLIYLAKIASQPYLLTRGPDATHAMREISVPQGASANMQATLNYNWTNTGYPDHSKDYTNYYLQNIGEAEYYVSSPPWRGGKSVPLPPSDEAFDSSTEVVKAEIPTREFRPGELVPLAVRGCGVQSYKEGGKTYQSWGPYSIIYVRTLPAQSPYGAGSGGISSYQSGDGTTVSCYNNPAPDFFPDGRLLHCQMANRTNLAVGKGPGFGKIPFRANSHIWFYANGAVEAGFPDADSALRIKAGDTTQITFPAGSQVFLTGEGYAWSGYPVPAVSNLRTFRNMVVPTLQPGKLLRLSRDGNGYFESGDVIDDRPFDGTLRSGFAVPCRGWGEDRLELYQNGYVKSCQLRADSPFILETGEKKTCGRYAPAYFDPFGLVTRCTAF